MQQNPSRHAILILCRFASEIRLKSKQCEHGRTHPQSLGSFASRACEQDLPALISLFLVDDRRGSLLFCFRCLLVSLDSFPLLPSVHLVVCRRFASVSNF